MNQISQLCRQLINRLRCLYQQANQQIDELLTDMIRQQITGFSNKKEEEDEEDEGEKKRKKVVL